MKELTELLEALDREGLSSLKRASIAYHLVQVDAQREDKGSEVATEQASRARNAWQMHGMLTCRVEDIEQGRRRAADVADSHMCRVIRAFLGLHPAIIHDEPEIIH